MSAQWARMVSGGGDGVEELGSVVAFGGGGGGRGEGGLSDSGFLEDRTGLLMARMMPRRGG